MVANKRKCLPEGSTKKVAEGSVSKRRSREEDSSANREMSELTLNIRDPGEVTVQQES